MPLSSLIGFTIITLLAALFFIMGIVGTYYARNTKYESESCVAMAVVGFILFFGMLVVMGYILEGYYWKFV